MIHDSLIMSVDRQQLTHAFGAVLTDSDFDHCLKKIEIKQPLVGKQFWPTTEAEPGIYIVLDGKVRLVDRHEELLITLEQGDSFGENTLFPEALWQPYSARASLNVKLAYLSSQLLQNLNEKYPTIYKHLYRQAVVREQNHHGEKKSILNSSSPSALQNSAILPPAGAKGPQGQKISQAYFPSPTLQVGHLWQRITRRYPFFQQQSASDCGAASLIMVGQYWGKRFSVNRLREISHADRNGASLRGLVLAAESIGFTTRPVKTNLVQLEQQSLPAIVHWEGNHYIVVYEVTKTHVIVGDPAIGQRTLTRDDFEAGWTGYTLLLQPTAFLKEAEESNLPFWQFIELVKPHRLVLLEIFLASVFIQVLGLITPVFTQLLLDRVVVQRSTLTLNAIGMGLLLFGLFKVAMTGLRQYLLDHVANRVDIALIVGFINHTLRLPLNFFESRYVGDIISRVQENHKIQQFLTGETLSIILDMLTMFVYAGLMFWYSWKLALLVLVIVPPFILLALVATPFLRRISREIFAASNEQTKYLIQSLTGIRTVKALAVEQTVRWHWEELFGKSVKKAFSGLITLPINILNATNCPMVSSS